MKISYKNRLITSINICTACSLLLINLSCMQRASDYPQRTKNNTWVFFLAGQSNMAGRGKIEGQEVNDTPGSSFASIREISPSRTSLASAP